MTIPLVLHTDSRSLFDCIVGLNPTTKKRLLIYLYVHRRSFELCEQMKVVWIPGNQNPADAMTKSSSTNALASLIETNMLTVDA